MCACVRAYHSACMCVQGPVSPQVYRGHSRSVTGLAVASSGSLLISCSEDGSARVWDVASCQSLLAFEGHKSEWCVCVCDYGVLCVLVCCRALCCPCLSPACLCLSVCVYVCCPQAPCGVCYSWRRVSGGSAWASGQAPPWPPSHTSANTPGPWVRSCCVCVCVCRCCPCLSVCVSHSLSVVLLCRGPHPGCACV